MQAPAPASPQAEEREPPEATTRAERNAVLLVTCLASFLTPFMGSALNLAIPAIGSELHISAVRLNWVVGSYLLASAAFLLPFGRFADLAGRRRVFLAGALVQGAFSAAAALAWSEGSLIGFRLLQGVGGAMVFATGMALLTSAFPVNQRGRVLGINTATVYTGLSLGPVLGGVITQHLGWRAIFALSALASLLVAGTTTLRVKREWRGSGTGRFDRVGAGLYAASLAALLGGTSALRSLPGAGWLLGLGAAGLAGFVVRERSCREPILEIGLFGNLVFALSNLAAFIHYSATFALGFLLSLYLQAVRGFDARTAGLILLVQPVLMALLSPLAGRWSDRVEPRLLASSGMAVTFVGVALFASIREVTPLAVVIAGLALVGVGFGFFSSPNTNAVMSAVERHQYGVAAATLGTMRVVGQASSLALVSLVFSFSMGAAEISRQTTPWLLAGMRAAFALFAGLCLVGTAASLARGRVR